MKKLLVLICCSFFIAACSHAPDPLSWKKDLADLKSEPINDGLETKDIYYELNQKSVWKGK